MNKGMQETVEENVEKRFRRGEVITGLILIVAVIFCIVVMAQIMSKGYVSFAGYSIFRVATGSMEPTISTGALLISGPIDIGEVQNDDIICFRSQESHMLGQVITHRVVSIRRSDEGIRLLETRGDANVSADGYFVSEKNLIGKVVWYSGEDNIMADALSFITGKMGFLCCIVFPVLMIAGWILKDNVNSIQRELAELERKQYEKEQEPEMTFTLEELFTPEEHEALVKKLKQDILEELTQREQQI